MVSVHEAGHAAMCELLKPGGVGLVSICHNADNGRGFVKQCVELDAEERILMALAGMEAESMSIALRVMLVISIVKPFLWPLGFIPALGMRAAGDVRFGMMTSSISMWVFRVGLTTLLCRVLGVGLIGIWCGYFLDWTIRSVCFTLRFRGERWHEHRVI